MDKHFKKGLVYGGILGSVIALFASSKKGKEMGKEMSKEFERIYDDLKERATEMTDFTRENYEKIADRVADEFSEKKRIASDLKNRIASELRKRYHDVQIYYLYSKIRSKLRTEADVTRQDFEDAIDDLMNEFSENKEIAVSKLRQMKRQLKSMWEDFKSDLEESDE